MKKKFRFIISFALALVLAAADPAFVIAAPNNVLQEDIQKDENLKDGQVCEQTEKEDTDSPGTEPSEEGSSGESVASGEEFSAGIGDVEESEEDALLDEGLPEVEDNSRHGEDATGYEYIPGEGDVESIADYGEDEDDQLMAEFVPDNNLPSYYTTSDLPPLRDQNPYGTCWAHSAIALAEISMIKQGFVSSEDVDYSELHLAYFTYNTATDPTGRMAGDINSINTRDFLNAGGNHEYASKTLTNWIGAADESTAPYSEAEAALASGLPDSIAYSDVAHLRNYYKIKTTGDADRDAIKQVIMDFGGAGISYYSPSARDRSKYYSQDHNSFYYSDTVSSTNHSVTVVGWNDRFPKENFVKQPQGDGAWLIRNSWFKDGDETYSYYGYFWMSYYDKGLANSAAWAYEYDNADNYDYIYQYDGATYTFYPEYTESDTIRAANVFTVAADAGREELKAVAFLTCNTNVNYTADIYMNPADGDDPLSGTKVSSVSGMTSYVGYYTVPLNDPVALAPGDKFSVVVTMSKSGDELDFATEHSSSQSFHRITATAHPGESFISKKVNGSWTDWEDTSGIENTGNVRIKAFTGKDPSTYPLVTFDANGGTFDGGSTTYESRIKEGKNYVFPTAPSMSGYDVVGWFTEPEGGTEITENDTVSGDITLYAHWTGKTYSVTFDANGGEFDDGSGFKIGSVKYDEDYGTLPTPHLTGQNFIGWYTRATGGENITSTTKVTQKSAHTLFAHWEIARYKITFVKNGGECSENERFLYYGDPYGTLPEPTRNHYSFTGWYSANRGGKKIEADTIMDTPNDHSLFARWDGEKINYTFDYNDGSGAKKYQTAKYGGCFVSFPTVTKTGYDLLGWFTDPTGGTEIKTSTVIDESTPTTFYAHWDVARFTLTLDANGGSFPDSTNKKTKEIIYGRPYGNLDTPLLAGQIFEGWFTAKTGGDLITKDTITDTTKNVYAYAHWKPDTNIYVQVNFDVSGGNPLPSDKRTKTVIFEQPYGELPVPTPSSEGKVFGGWYSTPSESGSKVTEYTTVKSKKAHTLYARWKDRMCTVTVDANGGKWDDGRTMIRITKKWGTGVTKEEIEAYGNPIKGSYRFRKAWFKDKDGNVPFDFNENIENDTIIYAGWEYVPGGFVVEGIDDNGYTYTGSAVTPKVTVYDYTVTPDRPLTESVDYTVTYKNNVNVGDASSKDKPSVIINGKGKYKNNRTLYFTIKPASLGNGQDFEDGFIVSVADKQYNGKKQISKPTIKYGKVTLKENKDYTYTFSGSTLVGGEPVNAGRVTVTVTASAGTNFTGSATTFYDICAKGTSLSSAVVSKIPDQVYTGEDISLDNLPIVVKESKSSSKILVRGAPDGDDGDYYVRYASGSNRKNAGTANLEIVGRGMYSGKAKASFKIAGKNVGTCSIIVDNCLYNGSAQKPKVTVTHTIGGSPTELREGVDYTLSYSNNTKAGEKGSGKTSPKAVIKGKGNYTGSVDAEFTIERKKLSSSDLDIVIPDIKGSGKTLDAKSIRPTVSYYDKNTGKTVKLSSGTDYGIIFTHDTSQQIQTAGFVLKGNYMNDPDVGEGIIERQFLIYNACISLSEALANGSLEYKAYTDGISYNGSAQKPAVTLKCSVDKKKVTLTEGKDYTLSYSNNTAAADYDDSKKAPLWKVTGKGAFKDAVYGTFTINKRVLTYGEFELVVPDVKYTGKQQNPSVKVIEKATGKAVSASEYTVTYGPTTSITENAVVIVTAKGTNGAGNYTGVLNGTFRVYANPITGAVIEKLGSQEYTGSQIRPEDVVIYSDKKKTTRLIKDVHYTLEYGENTKIGTGSVTVKGKGAYGGSTTVSFSIVSKIIH